MLQPQEGRDGLSVNWKVWQQGQGVGVTVGLLLSTPLPRIDDFSTLLPSLTTLQDVQNR